MLRPSRRLLPLVLAMCVPCCYWATGFYCLLSVFDWHEVVTIGVIHLVIFVVARRIAYPDFKALPLFFGLVLTGMLTILAVWVEWKGAIYQSFSLAVVGSVSWSIASWACITSLRCIRSGRRGLRGALSTFAWTDQLVVLITPVAVAAVVGIVHAMTNSVTVGDRLQDFVQVAQLGVGCAGFLVLPWFLLRLILSGSIEAPFSD